MGEIVKRYRSPLRIHLGFFCAALEFIDHFYAITVSWFRLSVYRWRS